VLLNVEKQHAARCYEKFYKKTRYINNSSLKIYLNMPETVMEFYGNIAAKEYVDSLKKQGQRNNGH
jgi:hypothetical protein